MNNFPFLKSLIEHSHFCCIWNATRFIHLYLRFATSDTSSLLGKWSLQKKPQTWNKTSTGSTNWSIIRGEQEYDVLLLIIVDTLWSWINHFWWFAVQCLLHNFWKVFLSRVHDWFTFFLWMYSSCSYCSERRTQSIPAITERKWIIQKAKLESNI